jgi:hypothetical protein
VRSVLVIPNKEATKLTAEIWSAKRNLDSASAVVFQRQDESLDNGDASALAGSAESRLDSFAATPIPVAVAPELFAFVADDVLGYLFSMGNRTSEERSNGGRLR